jgi:hypothetical protein
MHERKTNNFALVPVSLRIRRVRNEEKRIADYGNGFGDGNGGYDYDWLRAKTA